ncbi:aminotransferase class V-fold PLP-dependent enzyme [Clostridium sp. SYSU_GA19001]|uniref:aminotransferase class I/II-fold pyridoxal phosphate-dependent enzyme n=1 Tax=Clostridium caldaquaticum TaxID=2940653 RepID=UPI0020773947|nr:aminotransferase class I/II-fold pyridoxal phosphate-dependent enzyme [Clostridium caldaquaticum]MCM8709657.1 aminotransferase class V-fold PLP-dependent enzyme [Clostridium caldaquaticum]
MPKLPLVEGIIKYIKENNVSFSMPGHKGGSGFLSTEIGKDLYKNFLKADITEVDGVDNLHKPEGIIKESLQLLSEFYGSKKSYFLVNGSTSGNLAMIFSCFKEGDKVIVERNCHRSIFNAIIMRKLEPVYIRNKISSKYNAPMSIDMEHFLRIICENRDAKGIIITYPNYYGICTDLEFIISEAKKYNMLVLVDSAHGAHFGVHKSLPESALKLGADMVVMSSHKTLPSLTQTAYLHVGANIDIEKVDFYVSSFLSTSPSYMLMCSMDYGRYYLEEYGAYAYEVLLERANRYRKKLNKFTWLHVLNEEDIKNEVSILQKKFYMLDLSRFVINVKKGYSGIKLLDYLKSNKIQCEMSDLSNVVLIFSPFNSEEDFKCLYEALEKCNPENIKDKTVNLKNIYIPKTKFLPWQALEKHKYTVNLNEAEGKVCGKQVVPYPPGVPLLNIGEIIDSEVIDMIRYYLQNGITVLGIEEHKITVMEE